MTDPKPGAIVHVEFTSKDPEATKKFMEKVFGWTWKKEEMDPSMQYWTWNAGSGPAGGMMPRTDQWSAGTTVYILVASVDDAVAKIAKHGGKILMPKQEIPKVGWFAMFEAPGGVATAVFQSAMAP